MENVSEIPDNAAIIDTESGKTITYRELDVLSGKVYRFLSEAGIGKEDVVMIYLPRGIAPFVANIGVWKAGAAVVLLETGDYAEQNKEYIYRDCRCKLLLDREVFDAMMETETKGGYEQTDLHDLAYIIYTSGTTGHPKGVMQEFGTVDLCVYSMCPDGKSLLNKGETVALVTPFNFIATQMTLQFIFYYGTTLAITPLSYLKNPRRLAEKSREYNIDVIFMTPSFFKMFSDIYSGYKFIFLSSEPMKGVYKEGINCVSVYSQSEAGYFAALYMLDRAYEKAPLGKNPLNEKLTVIVDEQGDVLHGEGIGELCYWNPFFRGYVGLDELTKSVTDGNIVHSGDIGKQTAEGMMLYQGRKDDMVKINGNRVEPAEIEKELTEVLGVEWAAVRVCVDKDEKLLCAYYIEEPKISIDEAKILLRKRLADYKVPGIFMKIDKIPLNANGKFSRILLPYPLLKKSNKEYKAPSTKTEQAICDAMAKILGVEKFGVNDDFYEMGGDSLRSIRLIMELNWDKLEASMVFRGRTPERIARIYEETISAESGADAYIRNTEALKKDYPLMPEQQYMYNYQQQYPESTPWNLSYLLSFKKEMNIVRVQNAVLETMRKHPVFSMIYCLDENRKPVQRYVPETEFSLEIERTTEAGFADIGKNLVQPFKMLNSPLYRVRLFETEEKGYLFLDMHHSIVDGNSMHIFLDDIQRAYEGRPLDEDFYFLNLEERLAETASPLYEEGRAYYERTLDKYSWECYPTPDYDSKEIKYGCMEAFIPISPDKYDVLYEKYGLSKNKFYIAVAMLAISAYNCRNNVRISWVYHGRDKTMEQHIVGTLIKEFYVGIHIDWHMTLKAFFDEIVRQMQISMEYSCYPYPGIERMDEEGEDVSLIYQYDLLTFESKGEQQFTLEELPLDKTVVDNLLDIEIRESDGGCNLFIEYNSSRYKEESMHRFSELLINTACSLADKMYKTDAQQCSLCDVIEETGK